MARGRKRATKVTKVIRQTVKKSNRRRNRRRGVGMNRVAASLGMLTGDYAQSLSNPWSKAACIPDGANGTGCYSIKQVVTLGTATGSTCGIILNPQGTRNLYGVNTAVASADNNQHFTGNYQNAAAVSSIIGLYAETRVVSAGIRLTYVGNTQTDQGILLIGQVAEGIPPSTFDGLNLTQAQSYMQNYKLIPLRSGGQVTWRPQSMDDAMVFASTNGATAALTAPGSIPMIAAFVYGATTATASLALVDFVVNCEAQYDNMTFLPGGIEALPKQAEGAWYEKALNLVRKLDPIVPYVGSTLTNVFNSPAVTGAVRGGINSAMGMLLNPADRRGFPRLRYMDID